MRLHLAEGGKFPSREETVGESLAGALMLRLSKRNTSLSLEEKREEGESEGKEKRKLWRCPEAVLSLPL